MKRLALAIAILLASAATAVAANVDLNMLPLFGSAPAQWEWCSGSSCNKVLYVAVKNLGTVNTISHLYVGTVEDTCQFDIGHIYAVNCSTGAATSELGKVSVSYRAYSGNYWGNAMRAAQRPINAGVTICYRVDYGFSDPPGNAESAGCHYAAEVRPASSDTDTDHANHGNPAVEHGELVQVQMGPL